MLNVTSDGLLEKFKIVLKYLVLALKCYGLYWVLTQWPYKRSFAVIDIASFSLSVNILYVVVFALWIDLAISRNRTKFQLISIILMTFGVLLNTLHHKFFMTPIEVDSISILIKPLIWGVEGHANPFGFIVSTFDNFKLPLLYFGLLLIIFFIPPFHARKPYFSNKILCVVWVICIFRSWDMQYYQSPPAFSFYAPIVKSFFIKPINFEEKDPVKISITGKPTIKNIIFIIDESVRGDYLSINKYKKKTTPYLEMLMKKQQLVTYGAACSAANYSSTSNGLLRFGGDYKAIKNGVKHSLNSASTIFQYAQKAGFKTAYIDSQVVKNSLNDYMSTAEVHYIDNLHQKPPEASTVSIDHENVRILPSCLKGQSFVIMKKMGTHQPYENMYPQDKTPFTVKTKDGVETYRQNYENAINYKVDDFFKELIKQVNLKETVIIYTSDHGQAMLETPGLIGHGHIENPPMEEANVPMVVITENKELLKKFNTKKGQKSAFQIFPTLLELMGYDTKDIQTITKTKPLYENETPNDLFFLSGNIFPTDENPTFRINKCFKKIEN